MMQEILKTNSLSKNFGGLKAVNKINMSVLEGEIFGVIGPNGAGKTTLFNICSGNLPASSGQVYFKGESIENKKSEEIAKKGIARTFQNIQLFKYLTVLENVKTGYHIHNQSNFLDACFRTKRYWAEEKKATETAEEILEKLDIYKYRNTLAGNLPYGIQRKIEIARALALKPSLLMLDEPAAGMNPRETVELLDFIKKLNLEGYTIIVIEHDMKFIMNLCHRIMVINFGKEICLGKPKEVRDSKDVQEAYFGKSMENIIV